MESSLLYLPEPIKKHIKIFSYDNAESKVIAAALQGKLWEKKLYKIYKDLINPTDVVIDVGAFIGSHTVAFSYLAHQGKVYAFEPCRKPYDALSKTLEINHMDNVTLYKSAVTNKISNDEVMGSTYDGDSFIKRLRCSKKCKEEETVNTLTIDSLNLNRCDLIKIDVEGGEWEVMEGAQATIDNYRPDIFFETFRKPNMGHTKKLTDWCTENFYNWTHLKGDDYLLQSI